jgi:hypothetical protein
MPKPKVLREDPVGLDHVAVLFDTGTVAIRWAWTERQGMGFTAKDARELRNWLNEHIKD